MPRSRGPAIALVASAFVVAMLATPDPDLRPASARAEELTVRLGASTAAERDEASAALEALGEAARPALETAARSADPEVRQRARRLLARRGPDAYASMRRYRHAAAILRPAVAAGAALEPGSRLDEDLRVLLPEAGTALADLVRRSAERSLVDGPLASALARLATEDSLEALAVVWRDDRLVPSAGLRAAREMDAATDGDPLGASAFGDSARRAGDALGEVLDAREAPRRRAGIALAASFRGRGAADLLVRAASDPDPGVRAEVARALGRHAPGAGEGALRALAADADSGVRIAALEALGRVPGRPRPEPAVCAAEDDVPAVRRAAAMLLSREATPDELPLLERMSASDPSASVRYVARRSLATLRR